MNYVHELLLMYGIEVIVQEICPCYKFFFAVHTAKTEMLYGHILSQ